MIMETQTFEDVSPIKTCDFPASHVRFWGGNSMGQHCRYISAPAPSSYSSTGGQGELA